MIRALLALTLVALLAPAAAGAAERAVAWKTTDDTFVPRHGDDTLAISVFVDDCGSNADRQRVEVRRDPEAVTITVYDAEPKNADVCPEIAKEVRLEADLRGPLGRRALVDGSDKRLVFTRERPLRWDLADKSLPPPSTRRLRIAYSGCAGPDESTRAAVTRSKEAITITMLRRTRAGAKRCGTRIVRSVRLRGELGRRAVRDGGSSPPRIVLAGP